MPGPAHVVLLSHQDDDQAARELTRHLSPLVQSGEITFWSLRDDVQGGDVIEEELARQLEQAALVLLLISAAFLAGSPWADWQQQAAKRGTQVVPVLSSTVLWRISALNGLSPLPPDGVAVSSASDRQAAYRQVVEGIRARLQGRASPDGADESRPPGGWHRAGAALVAVLAAGAGVAAWRHSRAVEPPRPVDLAAVVERSAHTAPRPNLAQPAPTEQVLSGVVHDERGRPFVAVRVVLLGRGLETVTDRDGQFRLLVPGAADEAVTR